MATPPLDPALVHGLYITDMAVSSARRNKEAACLIGVAIQKAIEGGPAAQVCAQAQQEFQELLARTEG